jgi:DNA polymerase-3 subunit chi
MTTTVQFYHLTTTPVERALPRLLEKAYSGGFRILLVANSEERVEQLNHLLWTYSQQGFLPHGSVKDGNVEKHPILLDTKIEPRNGAKLLALIDGTMPEKPEAFERIIDMFDGNDPQAVEKARQRWTAYKSAGHTLSYLRQDEKGGWEQKAAA